MKIKAIIRQNRRDFYAIYICEHCGDEYEDGGYDDDNFHRNIIPDMICGKCGKKSPADYTPRETKYASWVVI
jgi:DNA-directed RNA polymerase subunit RPC12/RpoP